MKTEFKAKYLQHLANKNKDGGFTLIELLVVIIIVGVLAAIALPSFLNQIGKARGSEAKAVIGTVNRSQQTFRLEQNTMASEIGDLDARISGKFYSYGITAAAVTDSFAQVATTSQEADLKLYSGAVAQFSESTNNGTEIFLQSVCESDVTFGTGQASAVPTVGNIGDLLPDTAGGSSTLQQIAAVNTLGCPANTVRVD